MEVVVSLSQGRTAAAQCGLFTRKSVPVIFEPPFIQNSGEGGVWGEPKSKKFDILLRGKYEYFRHPKESQVLM